MERRVERKMRKERETLASRERSLRTYIPDEQRPLDEHLPRQNDVRLIPD